MITLYGFFGKFEAFTQGIASGENEAIAICGGIGRSVSVNTAAKPVGFGSGASNKTD